MPSIHIIKVISYAEEIIILAKNRTSLFAWKPKGSERTRLRSLSWSDIYTPCIHIIKVISYVEEIIIEAKNKISTLSVEAQGSERTRLRSRASDKTLFES